MEGVDDERSAVSSDLGDASEDEELGALGDFRPSALGLSPPPGRLFKSASSAASSSPTLSLPESFDNLGSVASGPGGAPRAPGNYLEYGLRQQLEAELQSATEKRHAEREAYGERLEALGRDNGQLRSRVESLGGELARVKRTLRDRRDAIDAGFRDGLSHARRGEGGDDAGDERVFALVEELRTRPLEELTLRELATKALAANADDFRARLEDRSAELAAATEKQITIIRSERETFEGRELAALRGARATPSRTRGASARRASAARAAASARADAAEAESRRVADMARPRRAACFAYELAASSTRLQGAERDAAAFKIENGALKEQLRDAALAAGLSRPERRVRHAVLLAQKLLRTEAELRESLQGEDGARARPPPRRRALTKLKLADAAKPTQFLLSALADRDKAVAALRTKLHRADKAATDAQRIPLDATAEHNAQRLETEILRLVKHRDELAQLRSALSQLRAQQQQQPPPPPPPARTRPAAPRRAARARSRAAAGPAARGPRAAERRALRRALGPELAARHAPAHDAAPASGGDAATTPGPGPAVVPEVA
ncbi:double-stranded DNA 3'-5' exodeoxyribonuclease [Aureococcus anophagefferens]|uniref:Double-stranded DNA 3'-5' exodeoxyribonuclease n=1 Tax=Aureococcus anophagefferens TaxID=44056 RepID=A0ABR1G9N2_AURAN